MNADRRWLYLYATIVMLATTIPYVTGYSIVQLNPSFKNEWSFSGFVLGVEDGNSYIAKELRGAAGEWLFKTPYTPVPQSGILAFLPFLLLGKLASSPGIHQQLVALYQLFRFFAGFFAIVATYKFLAIFIDDLKWLRLGTVLATIGGGLGWLWVSAGHELILGSIPLEFYSPETFGFLELYSLPHLSLARAFLMWGLAIFCERVQRAVITKNDALQISVCWLGTAIAQPITGIVFGIVLGLLICLWGIKNLGDKWNGATVDWDQWRMVFSRTILAGLMPASLLIYTFIKFVIDPYLSTWSKQNLITSPNFLHYLSAYGLLLLLGIFGIRSLYQKSQKLTIFLGGWVLSFPVLAYLPVGVQRRLIEGVWVAIVAFAMWGLGFLENKFPKRRMKLITWGITGFSLVSTILLLSMGVLAVSRPKLPVFRPLEEIMAFEFIGNTANLNDIVIASYETGNALPAWAPVRVVIGHGPESAYLEYYQNQIKEFFHQSESDRDRLEFLRTNRVKYIFWGPEERNLGNWKPASSTYLKPVYQSKNYEIFETTLAP